MVVRGSRETMYKTPELQKIGGAFKWGDGCPRKKAGKEINSVTVFGTLAQENASEGAKEKVARKL